MEYVQAVEETDIDSRDSQEAHFLIHVQVLV